MPKFKIQYIEGDHTGEQSTDCEWVFIAESPDDAIEQLYDEYKTKLRVGQFVEDIACVEEIK